MDERWWDYPPTGNVVFHNFAQHKLSASGMEKTRVFLSDLFGGTRSPPEYDEDLHDMLKTITGSVAVAHNGTRDRGPTLATIAFMAALWNPANVDFAECNWNCTSNLLPECATFQQIRSALAAIAGSGGLLEACVLTKGNPNGSELLEISCSSTCVSLNLKWLGRNDARSDAEAALGAASEPTKGSTRIALWKAQQALEHAGVRVSKIIIENNYLKFLPA